MTLIRRRAASAPLTSFVWKIASRCNLDCSYCFVYHSVDQRWRSQPKLMSDDVARQASRRLREHLLAHGREHATVIFHGGEPLLGGATRIARLVSIIDEELPSTDFEISLAIQTNLLLFDREIGDLFSERDIQVGVSVDGPPAVNDKHRVDHRGRPSSPELERKLALLTTEYGNVFSGFLSVIDIEASPVEVVDYLASWSPPAIDFLLPHRNHDSPSISNGEGTEFAPWGEWLCAAYDRSLSLERRPQIRIFDTLLRLMAGRPSLVESFGLQPSTLAVIETNGAIEGVDTLKTAYEGAADLGMSVFANTYDEAARSDAVQARRHGVDNLCAECRECPMVHVCGGGYFPHRYSSENGFQNPSVYCADIQRVIQHVLRSVVDELRQAHSAIG